ncbi:MAG TPA: aldehyde dehydrogenase family protein [Geminicoccaceae bacterium]|nr:aldehyde dehydrogenase family protein [Geminicoccus sp.]HMU51809.1 aldehyde dehydrogenase family protein [Geminicoccaceae bacterium]
MLDFDPDSVPVRSGHFIDGALVADEAERLEVRRASDGRIYAEIPTASATVVDHAVASADRAFRTSGWTRCAPRDRARLLRCWADLVDEHRDELSRLESAGSTRPISETHAGDVPATAETIRFFAELADKVGGEVAATKADHLGLVIREPIGVVAAISPWNFPISLSAWKIAPALAAGNAVVLKPSELTPFSVMRLAELAIAAGLPPGILNIVQGNGPETGDALCRHPLIGKITFTGSSRTGAQIMAASAMTGVKPVTLELGGKSPQIVFADVPDLDKLARLIARSFLGNAGQVCVAGTRLIVHRSIEAPLVERIAAVARDVKPGPTWCSTTTFSPIISERQAGRIDSIVGASLAAGAEAVIGAGRLPVDHGGIYYRPTILRSVRTGTPAVEEEIFGPVLTVQSFETEEEALSLADHAVYGLNAGLHTADLNRALRCVRRLQAGTIWVNRYGRSGDFILPTGGYKQSGIGKDLGREAFEANLKSKTVLMDISA